MLPILVWIDTVPFDGAIPLATSWGGRFWLSLIAIVLGLWVFKRIVSNRIGDA